MTTFKDKLRILWQKYRYVIIFCTCFFVLTLILVSLVPLFGDDWMWGSYRGEELLNSRFEGYNGRYVSNLLILGMTRSMAFRSIIASLFLTLIVLLPSLLLKRKSITLLSFSALTLMLTPKSVLVQGALWSSGFSNYVPPACFILVYIVLIRDIFDKKPEYTKGQAIASSALAFILGFIGTLFLETTTICALLVSFAAIGYAFIRYKKFYAVHLSYAVSAVFGAILMFSNAKNDGYRAFPSFENIKGILTEHTTEIVDQLFTQGIVFFAIISVLLLALALKCLGQLCGARRSVTLCAIVLNALTFILLFIRTGERSWELFPGYHTASALALGAIALVYFVTIAWLTFICINDRSLCLKALLCLACAAVTIGPMLIVEPYGPRCLFPAIIFFVAYATILLCHAKASFNVLQRSKAVLSACFIGAVLAVFVFLISIYSEISYYSNKRDDYVQKQLEIGYTELTVPALPYSSYTWHANIDHKTWGGRYRMFHEINDNVTFKALLPEEFDKWALEFDHGNNE